MAQPYDRMAAYLQPGDYVKFTSRLGNSNWLVIEADESMGQIRLRLADAAVFMAARAARAGPGTVVPPGFAIDGRPVDMTFLQPMRQDRIYQIIPTIFAINRTTQELIPRAGIPPLVEVEWEYPAGDRRGRVDSIQNVTINGVINNGVGYGRMPASQIYTRDDPNPVFQIFVFFGSYPAFRIINNTRGIVGGGAGTQLDYDWYMGVQGRKYIFSTASESEQRKLNNRELPYRKIPSPGGIPPTLLRRD